MLDLRPGHERLDPIEIGLARRDRGAAARPAAARPCGMPTTTFPTTRAKFDAAGVHPDDCRSARGPGEVPVHHQDRPARHLSVRHVRRAARQDRAHPRLLRHDRQADRRRLQQGRHRRLGRSDGALDPRRGRPARHEGPCRLWLRPVHRGPRRALRRGAARLHGHSGLGRHDRAAGAAHPRLQARDRDGDAVLHAGDPRRVPPRERRSRATAA